MKPQRLSDGGLGMFLILLSAPVLGWQHWTKPNVLVMLPAAEGVVTAAVVSLLLGLLAGLPYPAALLLTAPVLLLEALFIYRLGAAPFAVLALTDILLGCVGLISGFVRAQLEKSPRGAKRA